MVNIFVVINVILVVEARGLAKKDVIGMIAVFILRSCLSFSSFLLFYIIYLRGIVSLIESIY